MPEPSTKRIKVYSDGRALVGDDVAAKLGIRTHHRQVDLVVVATSKREAIEIAHTHGASSGEFMELRGRVDPDHGDTLDSYSEALRDAGVLHADGVGACYAHRHHGAVVDMTAPDRPIVGHFVPRQRGYGVDYQRAGHTDELRAAIATVEQYTGDRSSGSAALIPAHIIDALAQVVGAARTTLPREEG